MKKTEQYPIALLPRKDRTLIAYRNLSEADLKQLVKKSKNDAMVQLWTPKDAIKRFKTEEMGQTWQETRNATVIKTMDDDIATLVWNSEGAFPIEDYEDEDGLWRPRNTNAKLTFGIRNYEGYRGMGLGRPAVALAVSDGLNLTDEQMGTNEELYWLETDAPDGRPDADPRKAAGNVDALRLYESTGWRSLAARPGRIAMTIGTKAVLNLLEEFPLPPVGPGEPLPVF